MAGRGVLDLDGHRFFYCIYQDITERKKGEQHEEILRRSLELFREGKTAFPGPMHYLQEGQRAMRGARY